MFTAVTILPVQPTVLQGPIDDVPRAVMPPGGAGSKVTVGAPTYPLPPVFTVTSVTRPPVIMAVAVAPVPLPATSTSGSPVSPTAPFQVKGAALVPPLPGELPAVPPSVVAGSPRSSTICPAVPGYTVLKTSGYCVPGSPAAMSASPDNGPKENMYVCV